MKVKKGSAPFRPRARLIRLLGDELISDEVMAIVELAKNAYDADAQNVTITLDWTGDPDTSSIEIYDDGDGMDLQTLLNAWLEPATDRKRRKKERTALGRYPLGEKGVGRFAADKLGASLELITRSSRAAEEICLEVCWDQFTGEGYLDEVTNHWQQRIPRVFSGHRHGTRLRMNHLRSPWDTKRLTRVRDGLMRLVSPFSKVRDFSIALESPAFPDNTGSVSSDLLDYAPYHLSGRVDSAGQFYSDSDANETIDLRRFSSEQFFSDGKWRTPLSGPFRISLFVWDLDREGLQRAGMNRKMRDMLKRLSGVSIYRDEFRVWPYGTPGDDWLELNQRRVNNPTMRVSTNQIIGIVEVNQEENAALQDRTSREGLIDTPALTDLRALTLGAIAGLEEQRFTHRQLEPKPEPADPESDPVLQLINQLARDVEGGNASIPHLGRVVTAYRRQLEAYKGREARLMHLASIGMMMENLALEIGSAVSSAGTALRIARNEAVQSKTASQVIEGLKQVDNHLFVLGEQLDVIEPLYSDRGAKIPEKLDVRSVVQHVASVFALRLRRLNIRLMIRGTPTLTVRMTRAHLLQVLLGLFDNALHWTAQTPEDQPREICIQLTTNPPGFIFADSGPDIQSEIAEHIFEPFFSTRSGGRGLGLYLARSVLQGYGFSIGLLEEERILSGANLHISFRS